MKIPTKARYFWPLLLILFLTDCTTKDLVVDAMGAAPESRPILDSFVQLTLVHNPGIAFGLDLRPYVGEWARPILIISILGMIGVLVQLYRQLGSRSRLAGIALGLAVGGALGNLYDRIRFPLGVVDFIDVGIGVHRFWIFNVADAGIFVGGVLLAWTILREAKDEPTSRPTM